MFVATMRQKQETRKAGEVGKAIDKEWCRYI